MMGSRFLRAAGVAGKLLKNSPAAPSYSLKPLVAAQRCTNIPDNVQGWYVQEMEDSQKSQSSVDRSREVSGQQMSKMFGSNFMSNQGEIGEESGSGGDGANVSRPPYDADGNAHLESVLLTNLPEPFSPENESDLKEGLPEGLSDCVRSRGQRWAMEDRLDLADGVGKN